MELQKRRSIELAQLCQDQKRKEFEKQNELDEVQKMIRGKNDKIEEWKVKVRQCMKKDKKNLVSSYTNKSISIYMCEQL